MLRRSRHRRVLNTEGAVPGPTAQACFSLRRHDSSPNHQTIARFHVPGCWSGDGSVQQSGAGAVSAHQVPSAERLRTPRTSLAPELVKGCEHSEEECTFKDYKTTKKSVSRLSDRVVEAALARLLMKSIRKEAAEGLREVFGVNDQDTEEAMVDQRLQAQPNLCSSPRSPGSGATLRQRV